MIPDKVKHCKTCGESTIHHFSTYCGAYICGGCGEHHKLSRCYCGWAADGGNGRQQLEEMGETIEPEDY